MTIGPWLIHSPEALLFLPLALLPLLVLIRRSRSRRGIPVARLPMGITKPRWPWHWMGHLARTFAIICGVIALARPQLDLGTAKRRTEGLDIAMVMDTSGSMRAMDFVLSGSRKSRLDVVKSVVKEFVRERVNDRIGIVVFGDEAYTQVPLTLDHVMLERMIDQMEIGAAGEGTAIGDGLGLATRRMDRLEAKSKIAILLTDGANTAGVLDPRLAAKAAKTLGVKVYTILVGSDGVVPMPDGRGGFGFVEMKTDPSLLKEIAEVTGGMFFRATDTNALKQVYATIDRLETTDREAAVFARREEKFHGFAFAAVGLLVLEWGWALTRYRLLR